MTIRGCPKEHESTRWMQCTSFIASTPYPNFRHHSTPRMAGTASPPHTTIKLRATHMPPHHRQLLHASIQLEHRDEVSRNWLSFLRWRRSIPVIKWEELRVVANSVRDRHDPSTQMLPADRSGCRLDQAYLECTTALQSLLNSNATQVSHRSQKEN